MGKGIWIGDMKSARPAAAGVLAIVLLGLAVPPQTATAQAGGLSTSPDWIAEGNRIDTQFGWSVASAGDLNGDGYSDVIVGARGYDNILVGKVGAVFVYHGSPSGLSATPDWTAEGDQVGADFGCTVATANDVNGDGYTDIIVGARIYDNDQVDEGRAFVYYGSASGLSATPDWTAEANQVFTWFGHSVASAGDVNGDGYSDVIVGADRYDNGQTDEGRVFVYHGSASGLSPTPDWTAEGNQDEARFGGPSGSAGDVNGDGYSDVIVGARGYDNILVGKVGAVFVYHGSPSGLSATPDWTAEGDQVGADFGCTVATANDVNGDGFSDVIVGARWYDNGQSSEGRAFVYHGSPSGLSPTANWIAESNQAGAYFGRSVATAGDVNGDGYSDVIVGAHFPNSSLWGGRAYVYHGSASGLSPTANWIDGISQPGATFGVSVATAGDVNGDGCSDVIVGAREYDNGQENEGAAFVYYGAPPRASVRIRWPLYE